MPSFNIKTDDIGDYARQVLDRKGIDPDLVDTTDYTIADHLTDHTRAKLTEITPARFRGAEPTDARVVAWINRHLADPTGTGNLVLRGGVGTGKTTNAFAALWQIALTAARSSRRMTFAKISHSDFNNAMRPQPDGAHLDALAEFQEVDLLLFDDLGAGQVTAWASDTLYRLVDVRWAEQRPMIVTSNLTSTEMRAAVDERVLSRLAEATAFTLDAVDHRRGGAA
jgi:DNA replication protein DnaC